MFGLLEVWIWIEKEHLGQLAFLKEIGQIPGRRQLSQRITERQSYTSLHWSEGRQRWCTGPDAATEAQ